MSKQLTICCDMDDTIECLLDAWLLRLNETFGTHYQDSDITEWDMRTYFPNATNEELYGPLDDPEFWKTVKPREFAIENIKKLIDEGFDFYICTSSYYAGLKGKMENLLFRWFPFIDWSHVIIMSKKQMIHCDILIDDGMHNIEGPYIGLLYNTPHNQTLDTNTSDTVFRVYDWNEIYEYIHIIDDCVKSGDKKWLKNFRKNLCKNCRIC